MYRVVQASQLLWLRMAPLDGQPAKRISVRVPVGEPQLELIEGSVAPPVLAPAPAPFPETQAEEVWQLVQEWYAGRGEPVPKQDHADCMKMLEEERVARVAPVALPAPKPAYGTPEFWKAHWAKKRAVSEATTQREAQAQSTNPSAPAPPTHTASPKAKPPPKTPAAKATAQAGAPQESKSLA